MPTHRVLPQSMTAFRIGDPAGQFPIFSGEGARRVAGRWHRRRQPVLYAAEHYSTAMLELLVNYSGRLPIGQNFIEITIPAGVSYEVVTKDSLPGWERKDQRAARTFGAQWVEERRTAVLIVPSVVARMERNVIVNLAHADAGRITAGLEQPVWRDERLWG